MAYLKIISGEAEGTRVEINSDTVSIGRSPDNMLTIPSAAASSQHCQVVREGQAYTLKDSNATNGTYLNGALVREVRLTPEDIITVGGIEILFNGADVEAPPRSPALNGASGTERLEFTAQRDSFASRKSTRQSWVFAIAGLGLAAAALLVYFLVKILGTRA